MYLKSLTIKGFKSFPDRSKLLFSPGVSVIVGPNGSGKSNITDAVLWALGEQSPLAVRGQQMQDVIFSGGKGLGPRRIAEVEVVIDNSEGRANTEFSEISIKRRLERGGDGEYRLNGARCRLVDVDDVLSDTNLGREMHSVISQGRVEEIVNSKPRDRRMLIEEAAGLGKHRKRRRRAELKLEKTRDNLDRALDVEREARARLRPLKQQAQAAEVQARLTREQLELRAELVADQLRAHDAQLAGSETGAGDARTKREEIEARLAEVAKRREAAESRLAARDRERAVLGQRLVALRSTRDRLSLRLEGLTRARAELDAGLGERRRQANALAQEELDTTAGDRATELEAELAKLAGDAGADDGTREAELAKATQSRDELAGALAPLREALAEAEAAVEAARKAHQRAVEAADKAKRLHASLRGGLEAVEARLAAAGEERGAPALAAAIQAAPGVELALSAALGERLRAAIVDSRAEGTKHLDGAEGAARALLRRYGSKATGVPPVEDARPLVEMVDADEAAGEIAQRLLADTWLVEDLSSLPNDFAGIAVTLEGHCFDGSSGEFRRLPRQATDPALEARSEKEELVLRVKQRQQSEERATQELEKATAALDEALRAQEEAAGAARDAQRAADTATEQADRLSWLAEHRDAGGAEEGPDAVRRASLEAELAAERRHAEAAERTRRTRERDRAALAARIEAEEALLPELESLRDALEGLGTALAARLSALEQRSADDDESGEDAAEQLRDCSRAEAEIQTELRPAVEAVTQAEVEAAQLRDRRQAVATELAEIAKGLERELDPAKKELSDERHEEIDRKLERLERRREKLGPVNPLAEREYEAERERVSELESERQDVERALAELEKLISDTDRKIHDAFEETFDATAQNFGEMVEHLFPGGHGRLRRLNLLEVSEADESEDDEDERDGGDDFGVEIEVNPGGKAMKRLSLLSGGEKSLVAIAFVFAVFLARPCPFYILDEVEAALDDANIDRFLQLVRRFSDRAQFVIVTHQKRTMDAADVLYGVSMGQDGVTKIVSKRLPRDADGESGGTDDGESITVVEAA